MAECLRDSFQEMGSIGRLGGDEFVVFIHEVISKEKLEVSLQHFMHTVHRIECAEQEISCSIGVIPFTEPMQEDVLYKYADEALYTAKKQGRDQYIIAPVVQNI